MGPKQYARILIVIEAPILKIVLRTVCISTCFTQSSSTMPSSFPSIRFLFSSPTVSFPGRVLSFCASTRPNNILRLVHSFFSDSTSRLRGCSLSL